MTAIPPLSPQSSDPTPRLTLRRTEPESTCAAEALAGLFLGGSESDSGRGAARSAPDPAGKVSIDGLLLGHLPVFAVAWASQYAYSLSVREGTPIAVIRLRGGEARVDLVGRRVSGPDRASVPCASLAAAIAEAASRSQRWLVLVDDSSESELIARAGGEMPLLEGLILLTGADKAAVVAAYGRIKTLSEHKPARVSVAVVGDSEVHTGEVGSRLARAAGSFLGRKVAVEAVPAKISSHPLSTLFAGVYSGTLSEAVSLIRQASVPGSVGARPTVAEPLPVEVDAVSTAALEEQRPPVPSDRPAVSSVGGRWTGPRFETRKPGPVEADLAIEWRELVAVADDHARRSSERPRSGPRSRPLAEVVSGLTPIAASCPRTPEIELALGGDGSLHLLAWHCAEAMERLLVASSWAEEHDGLLRLAVPRLTGCAGPVRHVLTEEPRRAIGLCSAGVRVHAIATAASGETVCLDLN